MVRSWRSSRSILRWVAVVDHWLWWLVLPAICFPHSTNELLLLTIFLLLITLQDTVTALKKQFCAAKRVQPARQRLTLPPKEGQKSGDALKDTDKLSVYGLTNGSVLQFKDLGPQVCPLASWSCKPAQQPGPHPPHCQQHVCAAMQLMVSQGAILT